MKTRHMWVIIFSVIFLLFQSASAWAALAAPSNLSATAVSSSQINLTWTDTNSGKTNESGYSIERSLSPTSGFAKIGSVLKNITTYSNTGLASGTTYYYRVQATGRKGAVSPYSNVANATTLQSDTTPPISADRINGDSGKLQPDQPFVDCIDGYRWFGIKGLQCI